MQHPGQRVQIDVKFVPCHDGIGQGTLLSQLKHICFVSHVCTAALCYSSLDRLILQFIFCWTGLTKKTRHGLWL